MQIKSSVYMYSITITVLVHLLINTTSSTSVRLGQLINLLFLILVKQNINNSVCVCDTLIVILYVLYMC